MEFWSAKVAISLERVKIEKKLLWRAYRLTFALSKSTIPDPLWSPIPKSGGWEPLPKTSITIISGMGKATDFKFGQYIHRVHPNRSPLRTLEKRERGLTQIFLVPPIISGTGGATNFKFCTHIHMIPRNKSSQKKLGEK